MPFIHKIEARAYARATEVAERVTTAILAIFPEDVRRQVSLSEETVEGQSGDTILIISALLKEREACETTFDTIFQQMDKKDLRSIRRTLDLRVDTNCVFFLRIDKQGAYLGKLRLADSTDVIRVMIHFKDSPRCKQNDAILLIEEHLQNAED